MKTNLRKYLSIVLALLMLVSIVPMGTFAADTDVAAIGTEGYATLAEAIAAAEAGDTVTLLDNVTENVTISKKLTLDGADYQYTGKITLGKISATIKNVNFVDGQIYKHKSTGLGGTVTVENCSFEGDYDGGYAVYVGNAQKLVVENCSAKDVGFGFIYVPSSVADISVKDVNIDGASYGIHIVYNNTSSFENVTMKNVTYGILNQTYGAKTFTFKNCVIDATNPVYIWERNATTQNFVFEGANDFGTTDLTFGSKYVNAVGEVYAAKIGDEMYATLKAAFEAAEDGDVITLVSGQKIGADEITANSAYEGFDSYIELSDKNLTLDLNGKSLTVKPEGENRFMGVFYLYDDAKLTIVDSSEDKSGKVAVDSEDAYVYSLFMVDGADALLTIEEGNYYVNKVDAYSMLYASRSNTLIVNGGYFELGNAGTKSENGVAFPWIVNTYGRGKYYVALNSGTYNVDPTHHQGEARFPVCYDAVQNDDGTWSVVSLAVAAIGDTPYMSLKEAVAAAEDGDVITVIADHEIASTEAEITSYDMYAFVSVADKKVTIDLNGKAVTVNPELDKNMQAVFYASETGEIILEDSSEAQTGSVTVTMGENTKAYSMFSTDGDKSKLTIKSGNYEIDKVEAGYSMVYIAQTGTGYVSGGNFVLGNAKTIRREGGVMAPWIFNSFGNGRNYVEVSGGAYNTDPTHHWDEVKFPKGYVAAPGEDGMWRIVRGPVVIEQPTDITIGYGKMAKFAPEIRGEGLTYKWYYKDANSFIFRSSTLETATYDIKGLVNRDGRQVYCVAKDAYGRTVKTETATLYVVPNEELEIVSQPTVVEGTLDKTVSVALDVKGDDLTYKWYFRDKGVKNFQKSSLTSATYDITLTKARMGREVYCVITDAFGSQVTSDVITINAVKSVELKVSELRYDAVAVGETVTVKMDAEGEGLTYTWYFCNPNATKYTKSSIKDSEYSITLSKDRVGRSVYCVVTDAFGDSVTTEPIVIK